MRDWIASCVVLWHSIFLVQASLKCYCNTDDCHSKNSTTCLARYACYAEMFNGTAKYGCIHQVGYSSLCVRQGIHKEGQTARNFLLTCCYKQLCNTHIKGYKEAKPTTRIQRKEFKQKGLLIPEELQPLGNISVKVLAIISAGGVFILILIIACAVHLLCYDDRTKAVLDVPHCNDTVTILGHSSLV